MKNYMFTNIHYQEYAQVDKRRAVNTPQKLKNEI